MKPPQVDLIKDNISYTWLSGPWYDHEQEMFNKAIEQLGTIPHFIERVDNARYIYRDKKGYVNLSHKPPKYDFKEDKPVFSKFRDFLLEVQQTVKQRC